ncbi:hypothetical protein PINS_up011459 [Pythium insidiosum]|nr:hypothetical protein PINS_up011459 [Pythium insidiosum]
MVRVWLRPALNALSRQAAPNAKRVALSASAQHLVASNATSAALRSFSTKKDKNHEKKSLHDKFEEVDDITEVPPEVQFLSKEGADDVDDDEVELDPELLRQLEEAELSDDDDVDAEELKRLEELIAKSAEDDDDDLEDDEDAELSDAEWAKKYEQDLASIDADGLSPPEDDRLYIEMPGYDPSLSMASEGEIAEGDDDDDSPDTDPFSSWDQGTAYSPEMLNWMLPQQQRTPYGKGNTKPAKYFVRANHPDIVELAMDVDLLRLFISPTGRIRPRRFTGLTAKQQRKLAQAVKVSRQLALLPYLSRYPEPSPEQWRAMEEEEIAKLTALAENDDGSADDDDDDDFEDMDDE